MFPELTGFLFPNDVHIHWSLMIVMYPYITGLVAGSVPRLVALPRLRTGGVQAARSLRTCHRALLPRGRRPAPAQSPRPPRARDQHHRHPQLHLGDGRLRDPLRLVLHRSPSRGVVRLSGRHHRHRGPIARPQALALRRARPRRLRHLSGGPALDQKITRVLAAIGIPMACLLHGYVGFLFGALKANPWWSTPLMPVIFLFSAMVSGIALLIVLYQIAMKLKGMPIERLGDLGDGSLAVVVHDHVADHGAARDHDAGL